MSDNDNRRLLMMFRQALLLMVDALEVHLNMRRTSDLRRIVKAQSQDQEQIKEQ